MSVAVLLENFVAASRRMEEEEATEKAAVRKMMSQFKNPMEPLLAKLASSFVDDADLKEKLNTVYNVRCELPSHPRFLYSFAHKHAVTTFPQCSTPHFLMFQLCRNAPIAESFPIASFLAHLRNPSHPYDRATLNIMS